MLPGNRGCRQDFSPLLMHNLQCDGRADPTPTPMLQFMFNYSLKFKPHRQRRLRSLLTKGISRLHFLEKLVRKPLQTEMNLPGSPTCRSSPRCQHILADRESGRDSIFSPGVGLPKSTLLHALPQCRSDTTQSTAHK